MFQSCAINGWQYFYINWQQEIPHKNKAIEDMEKAVKYLPRLFPEIDFSYHKEKLEEIKKIVNTELLSSPNDVENPYNSLNLKYNDRRVQSDKSSPDLGNEDLEIEKDISQQFRDFIKEKNTDRCISLLAETFNIEISNEISVFLDYRLQTDEMILWDNIDYLPYLYTYKELFGIESEVLVPVLDIGKIGGYYIYLVLKTGDVYALHHETIEEYAYDYYDEGQSMDKFLNTFSSVFNFGTIHQLIAFSHEIQQKGYVSVFDVPREEIINIIQTTFNLETHELAEQLEKLGFEIFLYGLFKGEVTELGIEN